MGHEASAVRRYVDHVLRTLTISPSTLAQRAGISHTTLTRFIKESDGGKKLSAATIRKIETASGIAAAPILSETQSSPSRGSYPHPNMPSFDKAGHALGRTMIVPHGKGRTIRFGVNGRREVLYDLEYSESDNWGVGPLSCVAPLGGTVGQYGIVTVSGQPDGFSFSAVVLPFDPHDGARAWFIDTDTMLPRYGRGDIVLSWGAPRRLYIDEQVEGILWLADGSARFGILSGDGTSYAIDVVGARPTRGVAGQHVDIIHATVRSNEYQGVDL